tara:strand:- start:1344 stop:2201 length:858 start_codon:yes stop_codon:yes gene_type:complete
MNETMLGLALSSRHGLGISVSKSKGEGGLLVYTSPTGEDENDSFRIESHIISNRIRVALEWGAFAAETISSISITDSNVFQEYAKHLVSKGARLTLKINDYPTDPENIAQQEDQVSLFELRSSSPVLNLEDFSEDQLLEAAFEWIDPVWGMMLSILPTEEIEPEIQELESGLPEGAKTRVAVNRYERNRKFRNLCLTVLGASCRVCGFNFEDTFGALGEGYIHVHHVVPVSSMPEDYQFNALKDLVPVCPNCHSMLHREDPPLPIEKLKDILRAQKVLARMTDES